MTPWARMARNVPLASSPIARRPPLSCFRRQCGASDRDQMLIGAQKNPAAGNRRGRQRSLGQDIFVQNLQLTSGLEHKSLAAFVDQVDLTVGRDRRCRKDTSEAFLP